MSDEELKSMPSLKGYLNLSELKQALLTAIGQTSVFGLLAMLAVTLGESADRWYTGPNAATVVFVLTSIAAYFRSRSLARKYLSEGE